MPFKCRCLLIITPTIYVLDQLTKWLIRQNIPYGTGRHVIPGYFDLVHTKNTGAAFGMFAGADSGWREPFFYIVSAIAIVAVIIFLTRLGRDERLMAVILSLILGGVLGNLTDRIAFGAVTDFLAFHWRDAVIDWTFFGWQLHVPLSWPSFNVADSAITVSMILLAWQIIWPQRKTS